MVKKITAPKTYDPGKGRPKEHLAYLNQREMDYLRSINGNNMERGPRGLPSFPPDDAIGSSSRSSSSGNKTGVGGGGGGGGGSTGSRGSSTGSVGSRSGSEAPGNLGGGGKGGTSSSSTRSSPSTGAGGQRGAGSNYGPGSARPGTASSPMGKQGSSFSSPSAASSYNRDQVAQQRAAIKDAVGAVRSNSALKGDLQVGGIRTLSVGPMGTQVTVGRPVTPSAASVQNPAATNISRSISAQFPGYKYSSPLTPGTSPEDMARRAAEMSRLEQEIKDIMEPKYRDVTPTGNPLMAGSAGLPEPKVPGRVDVNDVYGPVQEKVLAVEDVPPEVTPSQAMAAAFPTLPSAMFTKVAGIGDIYSPEDEFYQSARIPSWSQSMPSGPPQATPATPSANDMTIDEIVEALRPSGTTRSITPETTAYNKYVDPVTQQPAYPEKGLPMKIAERMGVLGRALKLANWADKKRFEKMTPEQQAAEMERWANKRASYGKDMGQENDRGPYSRATPYDPRENTRGKKGAGKATVPESSGSRPQQYFNWDAGVGIPSPTDSDYTLYLKYLQEKAAARAAVS